MTRNQLGLAVGALLVIGGSVAFYRAKVMLKMPTPQQLQAAFPGDTRKVLEQSQHFTLLSLDPMPLEMGVPPDTTSFHGCGVMGQIEVSPQVKARLIAALYDGIARADWQAACFGPHHGIHAVWGKKSVDLLICFHCRQFYVYPGGDKEPIAISKSAQPAFDQALTDAGVPLSPR